MPLSKQSHKQSQLEIEKSKIIHLYDPDLTWSGHENSLPSYIGITGIEVADQLEKQNT